MAKAHVDPEELRRFSRDLKRFNGELEELLASMRGRLHLLEKTWQDQEQRKFTEEFERTESVPVFHPDLGRNCGRNGRQFC